MLRVINNIEYLKHEMFEHANNADEASHRHLLDELLEQAHSRADTVVPDCLFKPRPQRRTVEVHPETLELLNTGNKIAWATRQLLSRGTGNQRLDVIRAPENTGMVGLVRSLPVRHDYSAENAVHAILARTGNCDEHACVAFEIAKSLGIPAAVIGDTAGRHAFAVLYPRHDSRAAPVVVDPWPLIATTCLASEFRFNVSGPDTYVFARYYGGSTKPGLFNVEVLARMRSRLDAGFNASGMASASEEELRTAFKIRSPTLDRHAGKQGLRSYNKIRIDYLPPPDREEVIAERAAIRQRVHTAILESLAKPNAAGRTILWDARHTATVVSSYKRIGEAGEGICFDKAPAAVIEQALEQRARAKEAKFPQAYRSAGPASLAGSSSVRHDAAPPGEPQSEAADPGPKNDEWNDAYEAALTRPVIAYVKKARDLFASLQRLPAGSLAMEEWIRKERFLLQVVELRLDELPPRELGFALQFLVNEFNSFHPQGQHAVALIINKWISCAPRQHYNDVVLKATDLWIEKFNAPVEEALRSIVKRYLAPVRMIEKLSHEALGRPACRAKAVQLIFQRLDELLHYPAEDKDDYDAALGCLTDLWVAHFDTPLEDPLREILTTQYDAESMIGLLAHRILPATARPEAAMQAIDGQLIELCRIDPDAYQQAMSYLAGAWRASLGSRGEEVLRCVLDMHMLPADMALLLIDNLLVHPSGEARAIAALSQKMEGFDIDELSLVLPRLSETMWLHQLYSDQLVAFIRQWQQQLLSKLAEERNALLAQFGNPAAGS